MINRVYIEKKKDFAQKAEGLLKEIRDFLKVEGMENLRLLNRYDVEEVDAGQFERSVQTVFSDPVTDEILYDIPDADRILAVEYLPGQYDQRADSAQQCIRMIFPDANPMVKNARVYCIYGRISDDEFSRIKGYLINPVESRQASLDILETLKIEYDKPEPVVTLDDFRSLDASGIKAFISDYTLAMDADDLMFTRDYFIKENRDPTITEIRMLDTYWSDHCRHTTFLTGIDEVVIEDENIKRSYDRYITIKNDLGRGEKPVTLMDIATTGMRYLEKQGKLDNLEKSDEVNACTVRTTIEVDGKPENWLLLFKNETHNHPTEIEPFGGASTCVGGAIRDPLSGRSYVYQAMRLTGAGDPTADFKSTLRGKLPQRLITTTAAEGNSSYANQVGIAAGHIDEIYHPGYAAKRMEAGALVGAAPSKNVVKQTPVSGDVVILLGGRTGRDGIGGATGSSRTQNLDEAERFGAEVQKGDAPGGRKLQRLFRNPEASTLIKRCNDFGAGGVSVAIGELADGLEINLDAVPLKYPGLDGTEIAISESQERMAVVVAAADAGRFISLATDENLEATVVAEVTDNKRVVMRWEGQKIVDLEREFLGSNGAAKHAKVKIQKFEKSTQKEFGFKEGFFAMAEDLNCANKRGLAERFGSTSGAATLVMPYGGKYQQTPAQSMAARLPVLNGKTDAASVMAYGFDPYIAKQNPYYGGYLAVVDSLSKLAAAGALTDEVYLSFQEFFERLGDNPERWGKPFASLLGALDAQLDYDAASVGGKDSMSGSFEGLDVPPTLVSFAVSIADGRTLITPEFKGDRHPVSLLIPEYDDSSELPEKRSQKEVWKALMDGMKKGAIKAAWAVGFGGIAEAVFKMTLGNRIGLEFDEKFIKEFGKKLFTHYYGGFVIEHDETVKLGIPLGKTAKSFTISSPDETIEIKELQKVNDAVLKSVFPVSSADEPEKAEPVSCENRGGIRIRTKISCPSAVIPVFPGTSGEYDISRAAESAGFKTKFHVINNLTSEKLKRTLEEFRKKVDDSCMILIPSGMSCGSEPDGAGRFITAFFRDPAIKESVHNLLTQREGLIFGVGEGFKALLKLGLLTSGEITDADDPLVTLAPNRSGRYKSRMVKVRIASNNSPWLSEFSVGETDVIPVSGAEGRFAADKGIIDKLAGTGQIASQYIDDAGNAAISEDFNPFGSADAIEGVLSPDGRVFGRMGHCERKADGLYLNIDGITKKSVFESAALYFK